MKKSRTVQNSIKAPKDHCINITPKASSHDAMYKANANNLKAGKWINPEADPKIRG